MEVPWEGTQCIVCLEPSKLTEEHLIPAALGGRLTCHFLCVSCNSKLGHEVEGQARADPTIQLLAERVPRLTKQLLENQTYVSSGPGGEFPGRVKSGEFVVRSKKLSDDSLIQPTPLAAKSIRRMLEREGHDPAAVSKALNLFAVAPENTRIVLSPAIECVKWSVDGIQPTLDGPLLSLAVPLKMAYEFLALHLNTAIYEDAPALVAARKALGGNPIDTDHLLIERLHAPNAKLFHGLVFEGNNPHATVQVRLLGQLGFRVHFKTLSIGGPRFVYIDDLATNEENIALASDSLDSGQSGNRTFYPPATG